MAPLPPNNTARYKVFYTVSGHQHVMDIRSLASPASFGADVGGLLGTLSPMTYAITIDQVQFAASGSNVFNPVTSGIEGNVYGSGSGTVGETPYYINFVGRSTGGRRVRLAVFGQKALGGDYRYIAGENANIDAAVAVLQDPANSFKAIDGLKPIWKNYANAGVNAHWQKAVRP